MSSDVGEVDLGEDAAWIAAALIVVASLGGAVVLAEWPLLGFTADEPEEPELVQPAYEGPGQPGDDGTELWPYTSRAQAHETRTLGINVVFFGEPEAVHTALTERSEREWEEEQLHEGDADAETVSHERVEFDPEADDLGDVVGWGEAEGSKRYTYFEVDGEGRWVEESYQLHSGTYLGDRMHVRAYDDPEGEWTAVQVHDEHWDWFRLRHTVTGVSDSQRELERDFMDSPDVDGVIRMPFENETADGDGWTTGITLAAAFGPLLFLGVVNRSRRTAREMGRFLDRRRHEIALGVGLFALYTSVRWLGILGEAVFAGLSPKVVAAPLYVALVLGTPAVAYALGRRSNATWAFTFAALGLGAAFAVDFVALGVSVVPLRVVLHRGAVLLAVGLVAYGAARTTPDDEIPTPLLFGLATWAAGLLLPLLGYL